MTDIERGLRDLPYWLLFSVVISLGNLLIAFVLNHLYTPPRRSLRPLLHDGCLLYFATTLSAVTFGTYYRIRNVGALPEWIMFMALTGFIFVVGISFALYIFRLSDILHSRAPSFSLDRFVDWSYVMAITAIVYSLPLFLIVAQHSGAATGQVQCE